VKNGDLDPNECEIVKSSFLEDSTHQHFGALQVFFFLLNFFVVVVVGSDCCSCFAYLSCVKSFQVKLNDRFGNELSGLGDNEIEAYLVGPVKLDAYFYPSTAKTPTFFYFPTRAGKYQLHTKINGISVKNSPFEIGTTFSLISFFFFLFGTHSPEI
jgi:hypothetical protein